jgi:predicted enzyme related to lactoylglutathione lyase
MSLINNLFRVILYVQDMEAQVRFYRDMLGLSVRFPADLDDYSDQFWVEFETGGCTLVLHGGGEKRLGQDAPTLSFQVDDAEVARQTLVAKGVKVGEVRSPVPGAHVVDGFDPEGNRFSLDAHD